MRHANPRGLQGADAAAIHYWRNPLQPTIATATIRASKSGALAGHGRTSRDSRWDAINGYNLLRLGFNVYIGPDGKVLASTRTLTTE